MTRRYLLDFSVPKYPSAGRPGVYASVAALYSRQTGCSKCGATCSKRGFLHGFWTAVTSDAGQGIGQVPCANAVAL